MCLHWWKTIAEFVSEHRKINSAVIVEMWTVSAAMLCYNNRHRYQPRISQCIPRWHLCGVMCTPTQDMPLVQLYYDDNVVTFEIDCSHSGLRLHLHQCIRPEGPPRTLHEGIGHIDFQHNSPQTNFTCISTQVVWVLTYTSSVHSKRVLKVVYGTFCAK